MARVPKATVASLLVTAILAAPGGALAAAPTGMSMASEAASEVPAAPSGKTEAPADVLAAIKVSRAEAIAIARKHFTIPSGMGEPNVSISQSRDTAVWRIEWRTSSKLPDQISISVQVDAMKGIVTGFHIGKSTDEGAPLSYTQAEARQRAEEWMAKLAPADLKGNLRIADVMPNLGYYGGSAYQFRWSRIEKGYEVAMDGASVSIDARTGELTEYSLNWSPNLKFEMPDKVLTESEAKAAYQKSVPMVLQYRAFTKRGTDEREWRLIYVPAGAYVDQQGRLLGYDGQVIDPENVRKVTPVPASPKPYQKPSATLTQEQALAVAQAAAGRTDPPTNSNYNEDGEESKTRTWNFTWQSEGEGKGSTNHLNVRVDAVSGVIVGFNRWEMEPKPLAEGEKPAVSTSEAQAKAVEFLRTHRPDLSGSLQVHAVKELEGYSSKRSYVEPTYYVRFERLKNGVPVDDYALNVEVDARTGNILIFRDSTSYRTMHEKFPAKEGVMEPSQAITSLLDYQGVKGWWVYLGQPMFGPYPEGKESQEPPKLQLVWRGGDALASASAVDAKTGAPIDHEGRNLIEATKRPTDIAGHYAEREIELLWSRGVFDLKDGKFNPDQAVTLDDLARWIVLTRGMRPFEMYDFRGAMGMGAENAKAMESSSNRAYYGAAFQSGIIRPEDLPANVDLNGPVSRELFALWAARAMGYGRIAKMDAEITMEFTDKAELDAKYANAAALLGGLGIVKGDAEGRFQPKASLTRGDAAKILFATTMEGR